MRVSQRLVEKVARVFVKPITKLNSANQKKTRIAIDTRVENAVNLCHKEYLGLLLPRLPKLRVLGHRQKCNASNVRNLAGK